MQETKSQLQSKTIIAAIVTIAASVAGLVGYTVDMEAATVILANAVTLVTGAIAWWGRVTATKMIDRK